MTGRSEVQAAAMQPLNPLYYLHNFLFATDWIRTRYEDMLDENELRFLSQFPCLPRPAQALLVRMLLRKGPWFLECQLRYQEIGDVRVAAQSLLEAGFLETGQHMGIEILFALHSKAELLALFPGAPIHPAMRKAQMLEGMRTQYDREQSYAEWNPRSPYAAWRVTVGALCERFRLMFFGNLRQGWAEFVLADLGIFHYEKVPFDRASRGFESRAAVDGYLALHRCRDALDGAGSLQALLADAVACPAPNAWLEQRRAKLLLRIGQACERRQDWTLADQAYARSHHPDARHRRARVCERAGRLVEALALAQEAHAAPQNEQEAQRAARMLARLQRSLGYATRPTAGRASTAPTTQIEVQLDRPSEPMAVEALLCEHWSTLPAPVFFVENALLNSLFGLLCWPAIFAPLPGAFFQPFQSGPADLDAPDFVQRRSTEFAACLSHLHDASYQGVLRERFVSKRGLQSPFVSWGVITPQLLELALACIPPEHLRRIFVRMLQNLKANRSGFPDLVRFWPKEGRYALVEVKAPGDRLQDNQVRWLHHFGAHGIPASVCHVRWREAAPSAHLAPPTALQA
jgi:hypothetical protein